MMFNARITFNLTIVTSSGTRFLSSPVTGYGVQDGIALGTYSQNSKMSDYLAKFNCEVVNIDFDENNSQLQMDDDLWLIYTNGDYTHTKIPVSYSLKDANIAECKGDDIEKKYGKNNLFYLFIQKVDSKGRRLSDGSRCTISGNVANLNIDGTVEREDSIIDRTFTLKTNDNRYPNCTLNKEAGIYDANLECTIENPGKNFYLTEDDYIAIDGKGDDYLLFTANNIDSPLCKYYSSDDSERSDSSSSGGLSGGAITGIVIACVVVVVVIGTILFFVYKGGALFAGIKAGNAAYSEAGASSISNMNIKDLKK